MINNDNYSFLGTLFDNVHNKVNPCSVVKWSYVSTVLYITQYVYKRKCLDKEQTETKNCCNIVRFRYKPFLDKLNSFFLLWSFSLQNQDIHHNWRKSTWKGWTNLSVLYCNTICNCYWEMNNTRAKPEQIT